MVEFFQSWRSLIIGLGIIAGAGIIGLILHYVLFLVLSHLYRVTSHIVWGCLVRRCRQPLKYLIVLLAINFAVPLLDLPAGPSYIIDIVFRSLFILTAAWLIIRLAIVGEEWYLSGHDIQAKDNLQARRMYTQLQTLRKIFTAIVFVIAAALVLMGFEQFRTIGTGILASAGLAGLILGFAAQKIFANLLAGIQIAFTQPIRVDDVVIVENEWGWIEEITLTYVVVRIWDLRRLVLPISYFIETPFQNWTRVTADILGTVFIYTDYTIPVQEVRQELGRILQSSDKWDKKAWGLQITSATERTMELRALMSAADSSAAWDLRCEVREKLIEFIQKNYPHALPKTRAELEKIPAGIADRAVNGAGAPATGPCSSESAERRTDTGR